MRLSFPFPGFIGYVDEDGLASHVTWDDGMPRWAQIAIEDAWMTGGATDAVEEWERTHDDAREDDCEDYHRRVDEGRLPKVRL